VGKVVSVYDKDEKSMNIRHHCDHIMAECSDDVQAFLLVADSEYKGTG